MANAFTGSKNAVHLAGGISLTAQSANPIASGDTGFWFDGTTVYWVDSSGNQTASGVAGNSWHEACRLATTAAITGTYSTTTKALTVTATGRGSIDSVNVTVGDRLLLKTQSDDTQNGIYVVTVQGTTGVSPVYTRAADCNASNQFEPAFVVAISEGTVNADSVYVFTADAPFTMDTSSATFAAAPFSITYGSAGAMSTNGLAAANNAGVANSVARIDHTHAFATDLLATKEVDHVVYVTASSTSATAGGALTVRGGVGKTSGTGGAAKLIGGAADTAAAGGDAIITGGAGGSASGNGGAVTATGGAGTAGNGVGGAFSATGGAGQGSGNGGASTLVGGAAGATGTGGATGLTGGAGGSASGAGGAVAIAGGAGTLNANGGAVTILGGAKNGSGTNGTLSLGTSNTSALTIGADGIITTWNGPQAASATANLIADPGGANAAIPVTRSGVCAITTAGAETNTLAAPTFIGQELCIICDVYAVGDRVITAASAINQAGNTIMTFGAVKDMIVLKGMQVAGVKVWRVVANDGVALS